MAHMGSNPENLAYVGYLLDTYPNYYVDIAAVIAELGRQPIHGQEIFYKISRQDTFWYRWRVWIGSNRILAA